MRKRVLGRTDIEVSELGFGGWAIGGDKHGNSLGPTDDKTSRAAIDAALEGGVTFFDTADVYGWGRSEWLLGEAITAAGRRDAVVIATKGGTDFRKPSAVRRNYEGEYLKEALGRSLKRLRTDHVDLFQLHDPPVEAIRSPEVHAALARLKEEKLARAVGVTLHTVQEGLAALECDVYDTVQVQYNVADQWTASRLLEPCCARSVGVILREPLQQGFLAGRYGPDHAFTHGDIRARVPREAKAYYCALAEKMRDYFQRRQKVEKSLAAIALQFALAEDSAATVIASMKTPEQVRDNLRALDLPPLERKHLAWLRE